MLTIRASLSPHIPKLPLQAQESVTATASGNSVPIKVTVTATAVAEAEAVLGSSECGAFQGGSPYVAR